MNERIILGVAFLLFIFVCRLIVRYVIFPEPTYHRIGKIWRTNYPKEGERYRQMAVNTKDATDMQEVDVTNEVKR